MFRLLWLLLLQVFKCYFQKNFNTRSCCIFMLFKWASQDLSPYLHQQMKINPALHKLWTAICPVYPSKHHMQLLKQPSQAPRNPTQKRPTALIRSRSKQDGSVSPVPSLLPDRLGARGSPSTNDEPKAPPQ